MILKKNNRFPILRSETPQNIEYDARKHTPITINNCNTFCSMNLHDRFAAGITITLCDNKHNTYGFPAQRCCAQAQTSRAVLNSITIRYDDCGSEIKGRNERLRANLFDSRIVVVQAKCDRSIAHRLGQWDHRSDDHISSRAGDLGSGSEPQNINDFVEYSHPVWLTKCFQNYERLQNEAQAMTEMDSTQKTTSDIVRVQFFLKVNCKYKPLAKKRPLFCQSVIHLWSPTLSAVPCGPADEVSECSHGSIGPLSRPRSNPGVLLERMVLRFPGEHPASASMALVKWDAQAMTRVSARARRLTWRRG